MMVSLGLVLSVVLCDQVGLDSQTWLLAKSQTDRIFNDVGVEIVWLNADRQKQCPVPATGHFLVVVLAPKNWATPNAMGISPANTNRTYVFYNLIQLYITNFAHLQDEKYMTGMVIGHAIAHELGHRLIPGNAHGAGIMRPNWSYDEWRQTFAGTLKFQPEHAKAIREQLPLK